jgi:hypothetical protein
MGTPVTAAHPADDLTRLLETEARLAAALQTARAGAAAVVAAARRRAAELEARLETEVAAAARDLAATIAADRDRRRAQLAAAARSRAAALDGVGGAALERLADAVVDAVLREGEGAA